MPSKLKLLWLQGITCNGNAHSFLNHPRLASLLKHFELLYHPLLPSSYSLEKIVTDFPAADILIFEGAYSSEFTRADVKLQTIITNLQQKSSYIIAAGTCAAYGGIMQLSDPKSSGIIYTKQKELLNLIDKEKLISIPGCPIHPEWLGYVLEMIIHNKKIPLDNELRPSELFAPLTHHGCDRNEYFEWKVDAKQFGEKEGCLYYEQGCRGVMTHSSCNKILWNEVSSKTKAGTPCFGCTESDFPRSNMFHTKTNMSIPEDVPLGVGKKTYLTIAGIAKTFHIKRLEGKLIDYKTDNRKD